MPLSCVLMMHIVSLLKSRTIDHHWSEYCEAHINAKPIIIIQLNCQTKLSRRNSQECELWPVSFLLWMWHKIIPWETNLLNWNIIRRCGCIIHFSEADIRNTKEEKSLHNCCYQKYWQEKSVQLFRARNTFDVFNHTHL